MEGLYESDRSSSRNAEYRAPGRDAEASIYEVSDGRGVLVRVLRVGMDGTDKEINAAEYGAARIEELQRSMTAEGWQIVAETSARFMGLLGPDKACFLNAGPHFSLVAGWVSRLSRRPLGT